MSNLIRQLIQRGCKVEITKGQLSVTHPSDSKYNDQWHSKHHRNILCELANAINEPSFMYEAYSTGNFDNGTKPGARLQFIDISTGETPYAIFNVSLKRVRKSKQGKAGAALPKGRFIVSTRSMFYKFWLNTGLPFPRSLSEFYKCMGKLKPLLFAGQVNQSNKLINKSLVPTTLSHAEIMDLMSDNSVGTLRQASDKEVVSSGDKNLRQHSGINSCDKENPESVAISGLSSVSKCVSGEVGVSETTDRQTTCAPNYEIRLQEEASKESTYTPNKKRPEDQSMEEWLRDYDEAS